MAAKAVARHDRESQPVFCRVCSETKSITEFYPRQIRQCKTVGECKECTRLRVRSNRDSNVDYYRNYDRKRYRESDERKAAARKSANSPAGLASNARCKERLQKKDPLRKKARTAVGNAIRDGRLERDSECFFCGGNTRLQAHHPDYSRPLDVFWLCASCHGKLHIVNGDFLKAKKDTRS